VELLLNYQLLKGHLGVSTNLSAAVEIISGSRILLMIPMVSINWCAQHCHLGVFDEIRFCIHHFLFTSREDPMSDQNSKFTDHYSLVDLKTVMLFFYLKTIRAT
jgi:hypothetical protein